MPVPEGFILPEIFTAVGSHVMTAKPTAEAVAGPMGVMSAEVVRHREFNAEKTRQIEQEGLPGEMCDEIELIKIRVDKFTTVPLRGSNLTNPKAKFHNELSIEQQTQLADLRERFRKNEHGSDTPIPMWEALTPGEQYQLMAAGVHYVEQLANYKEHEIYRLGNGGEDLVKRAQRHISGKKPNREEDFARQMSAIIEARQADAAKAEEREKRYLEQEAKIAAMEKALAAKEEPRNRGGRPRKAGVQEE